jgi:hypothetical protein
MHRDEDVDHGLREPFQLPWLKVKKRRKRAAVRKPCDR